MKGHAARLAVGGIVPSLAMVLATIIANEAQTLLGLHLDNVALAIYLTPFLLGAAAVLHKLLGLEATNIATAFAQSFAKGFEKGAAGEGLSLTDLAPAPGAVKPATPPPPPPPPAP